MGESGTIRWRAVERWSDTAFRVAGVASLGTAVLFGVEVVTAASIAGWVTGVVGMASLLAAFAGLVGLYPGLAVGTPRLARAGLAAVALAGVGLVVFPLCALAKSASLPVPVPPLLAFVAAMLALILGVLVFGVASLRSDAHPRSVGLLLLGLVGTFVALFAADLAYGGSPAWVDAGMGAVQAVLLVRIGQVLPATVPSERAAGRLDAASG